ncbi:MAG: hypothetical protein ACHQM6_00140 [Candidatus Kapaibacterium sp.]
MAEGIIVFAGVIVLVVQFAVQKYFLSDQGIDHTQVVGAPLDDVYIHCRYAENVLTGHGYSFNPGHTVSADTSPLWVMLIAIGGLFSSHLDLIAVILSSLFYVLLAPLVFRICRNTFEISYFWSLTAGVITLLSSRLVWASASGMEVSLACLLTLIIFHEHFRQRQYGGSMRIREGIFLALGIAARPELMFLALICLVDWFFIVVKEKKGFWNLLKCKIMFLVFVSPVYLIPYFERQSLIYHSAIVQGARISFLPDMGYLLFALKVLIASFSIPVVLAFLSPFLLKKIKGLAALQIFGLGLPILLAFIAPQFRHHGRYFFEVFPVLIILGILTAAKIFSFFSKNVVIYIQSVIIAIAVIGAWRGILLSSESVRNINDQHLAVASWLNDHLTVSDKLAVDDVGAIGYFSKQPVIDLTGLISPEFFPLQKDQSLVWKEARRQGANLFIIYTRLNPTFYQFARDSLQLIKEFRVREPLVAGADTVMSVFKIKEDIHATR